MQFATLQGVQFATLQGVQFGACNLQPFRARDLQPSFRACNSQPFRAYQIATLATLQSCNLQRFMASAMWPQCDSHWVTLRSRWVCPGLHRSHTGGQIDSESRMGQTVGSHCGHTGSHWAGRVWVALAGQTTGPLFRRITLESHRGRVVSAQLSINQRHCTWFVSGPFVSAKRGECDRVTQCDATPLRLSATLYSSDPSQRDANATPVRARVFWGHITHTHAKPQCGHCAPHTAAVTLGLTGLRWLILASRRQPVALGCTGGVQQHRVTLRWGKGVTLESK